MTNVRTEITLHLLIPLFRRQFFSYPSSLSRQHYVLFSDVLLKMEVDIRKGHGEGPEGTLLIYDH